MLLQCAFTIKLPLNVLTARLLLKNKLLHKEFTAFVKEKRIKWIGTPAKFSWYFFFQVLVHKKITKLPGLLIYFSYAYIRTILLMEMSGALISATPTTSIQGHSHWQGREPGSTPDFSLITLADYQILFVRNILNSLPQSSLGKSLKCHLGVHKELWPLNLGASTLPEEGSGRQISAPASPVLSMAKTFFIAEETKNLPMVSDREHFSKSTRTLIFRLFLWWRRYFPPCIPETAVGKSCLWTKFLVTLEQQPGWGIMCRSSHMAHSL